MVNSTKSEFVTFSPDILAYPSILEQEEKQTVNGKTGILGPSEQSTPINQVKFIYASSMMLSQNRNRLYVKSRTAKI